MSALSKSRIVHFRFVLSVGGLLIALYFFASSIALGRRVMPLKIAFLLIGTAVSFTCAREFGALIPLFEEEEDQLAARKALRQTEIENDLGFTEFTGQLERENLVNLAKLQDEVSRVRELGPQIAHVLKEIQDTGITPAQLAMLGGGGNSVLGALLGVEQINNQMQPPIQVVQSQPTVQTPTEATQQSPQPATPIQSVPVDAQTILRVFFQQEIPIQYRDFNEAPSVRRFNFNLTSQITKAKSALSDIELALGYPTKSLTMDTIAPNVIGIEVPRRDRAFVQLPQDIIWQPNGGKIYLGESLDGRTIVDLTDDDAPHLMAWGTTGSGKSQTLRTVIHCLQQQDCSLFLFGGKQEDYGDLGIKIHSPMDAPEFCGELFRKIEERKNKSKEEVQSLKRIVVVIEEYTHSTALISTDKEALKKYDLSLTSGVCVGRSLGIHFIVAVQRPAQRSTQDPNAMPGSLRSVIPGKIAFANDTSELSTKLLNGYAGSTSLLGKGDGVLMVKGRCSRFQGYQTSTQQG